MKRMVSLLLSVVLLLSLVPAGAVEFAIPAAAESEGYYTYTVTDGKATITAVDTAISGAVTIPSTLGGYPVVAIGEKAFLRAVNMVSLVIPNSVTTLEYGAFSSCTALTEVTFPIGMKTVRGQAFAACSALKAVHVANLAAWCGINFASEVANPLYYAGKLYVNGAQVKGTLTVPQGVTRIGSYAFYQYTPITAVTIPTGMEYIGSHAFYGTALTKVTFNAVDCEMGEYTFADCSNLTSIVIGTSVKRIPNYAFGSCKKVTSVTLPSSVTAIGYNAFAGCTALTTITLPSGLQEIGSSAFQNCTALKKLSIPQSVTSIGLSAFENCTALTAITLPTGLKELDQRTFAGCSALASVTLPNSITRIGYSAFSKCTSLRSVVLPTNLKTLSGNVFEKCTALKEIAIPSGVTSIGASAFEECEKLATVTLPNSLTSLGDHAFAYCTALTSIAIPQGVTMIEPATFIACRGLTEIVIPDAVTSIGYDAFAYCSGVTSLRIGDGVETIASGVFRECTALESVRVGNSVESIGVWAFENCKAIAEVHITDLAAWCGINFESGSTSNPLYRAKKLYLNGDLVEGELAIPQGVTRIGSNAFYGYPLITAITVPKGVTTIGAYAFSMCSAVKTLMLPKSVKTVMAGAFSACGALSDVWYAGSATDREAITINSNNTALTDAVWHYAGECQTAGHVYTDENDNICNFCGDDKTLVYYTYTVTDGKATVTDVKTAIRGEVIVPDTLGGYPVTALANNAFRDCKDITAATIPASVTSIGNYAFKGCTALTTVYYNAVACTTAGAAAYPVFDGCTALTTLYIGEGVESLPAQAFRGIPTLKTVYLPKSVTTIEKNAFYQDTAIFAVHYGGTTADREAITVALYNASLTNAKWLYAACEHTYDNACDADCNLCGKERLAARHKWNGGVVLTKPTATVTGSKKYTCTVCGSTAVVETTLGAVEDGTYYYEGVKTANAGLVMVDGAYYYVAAGGQVKTGRYAISNVNGLDVERGIYYFFEDGTMNTEEGVYDGYYYNEQGKSEAYAGLIEWGGSKYYVNDGGRVKTGRYFISKLNGIVPKKRAYTFYGDGRMLEETRIYEADGFYYEDGIRIPYAGLVEYEGHYYYVTDNGAYVSGRRQNVSNTGYTDKSKGMYYFNEDGYMQMGVVIDGFYYGTDGLAPTYAGVVKVGSNYYYVGGSNGALTVSKTITIGAAKTNGLIAAGKYTADATGKLTAV